MMKIYDDLMPTPIQYQWELALLKSNFSWNFLVDATSPNQYEIDNVGAVNSFGSILFDKSDNYISPEFPQFYGGLFIINDIINKRIDELYRFRVGLFYPIVERKLHHKKHTDFSFNHLTVLYYVTDSDGDTFFFDDDGNIIDRIKPKKGRIVVFDGKQLHASSSPSKNIRVAVNINYIK